ncbi:MAG: ABC transporter permease [Bdellovibrionota bacterium]|jgi:lipopolysaccharide transport system permease protein
MFSLLASIRNNAALIWRLSKRDIESRYRGTFLGILWAIFIPVLLLLVYTFVFSVVFKARWGEDNTGQGSFALILFCGLIFFNLFAECINRAPTLILSNAIYVKKILFPLEILPIVTIISALFNFILSYLVLMVGYLFIEGIPSFEVLLVPLLLIPFCLLTLGLTYFLASLGVFVRDLGQIVGVFVMILMFLSPIFYPLAAIPEKYQAIINLSPVTIIIEAARGLMFRAAIPNLPLLGGYLIVSIIVLYLGFLWFKKTEKGFADVI